MGRHSRKKKKACPYHGILLVDKPKGISSFDVIRQLRKQLKISKIGHTGTLDPMASGVLVLCLGDATKLVQYLTADDKYYSGEVTLGKATNTYDAEGEITAYNSWSQLHTITQQNMIQACEHLTGKIKQKPPIFSAIKVDGERLYAKARRGESVEVPTRDVIIHDLKSSKYVWDESLTQITFDIDVHCSKGTYIRSLAVDLARELSVEGHLSALRRTACGQFKLTACHLLDEITPESVRQQLISIYQATQDWPHIEVNKEQIQKIEYGQKLNSSQFTSLDKVSVSTLICACDSHNNVVALLEKEQSNLLKVVKGFYHSRYDLNSTLSDSI